MENQNQNQNQRKSVGTIILVILLLIVTIVSLVLATYAWARYTTVEQGEATASVAQWDVSFTKGTNVFEKEYNHVVKERLAPGTSGKFEMHVNSNETEVSYEYRIRIKDLKNKPTNLHFYMDEEHTKEICFYNDPTMADEIAGSDLYGRVVIKNNKAQADRKVTIYWNWEYQSTEIYPDENGTEALPADLDVEVSYTDTTADTGATTAKATKRERIIHDVKAFMSSKGIADSEYTIAENGTAAELLASLQALAAKENVTKAEIDQVINDAIDTVDGLAAREMSFVVEYTAIQCLTTETNGVEAGKTKEFSPYIDYSKAENN